MRARGHVLFATGAVLSAASVCSPLPWSGLLLAVALVATAAGWREYARPRSRHRGRFPYGRPGGGQR